MVVEIMGLLEHDDEDYTITFAMLPIVGPPSPPARLPAESFHAEYIPNRRRDDLRGRVPVDLTIGRREVWFSIEHDECVTIELTDAGIVRTKGERSGRIRIFADVDFLNPEFFKKIRILTRFERLREDT